VQRRVTRREALAALGGGLLALPGCGHTRSDPTGPTAVAGERLSFNVQPLGGASEALQLRALGALGAPWIRIAVGLATDTQARSYVRAVPNALGILTDFGAGTLDPAAFPGLVEISLRRYPQLRAAELLNEPDVFNGLSPARYVRDFLRPGYDVVRERFPGIAVVAAAPVGTRAFGPSRFRQMTDAGADDFCDYRGAHVYFEDEQALADIAAASGRPILVTETGTRIASLQGHWYQDVVPRLRQVLGARLVFWYVLLEAPAGYPGYSVIASGTDATGLPQAAPGTALYPLLAGGRPLLRRHA